MKKLTIAILTAIIFLIQDVNPVLAARGCCSWHGGVSHCDTSVGRYVCNDGTYSPSCGCAYIPPKPRATTKPIVPTTTPTPIRIATPTPIPIVQVTNNSSDSGDNTIGWLTLAALGGGGYWLYKRAKNKKKPEENTPETENKV